MTYLERGKKTRLNHMPYLANKCDSEVIIILKDRNGNGPLLDVPQVHWRKSCSVANDDAVIFCTNTNLPTRVVDCLNFFGACAKRRRAS